MLSNERILWEGRPSAGIVFRPIELFLVPLSLFWAGFAFFWNYQVWTSNAPLSFAIFGIPFLVAGFYVTIGRFLLDIWVRSRTSYRLTNRRVIVLRGGRPSRSLDLLHLPALELVERGNGNGTIRFDSEPNSFLRANGFGIWSPSLGDRCDSPTSRMYDPFTN